MRLFEWLPRRGGPAEPDGRLDVERVLEEGLADRESARRAIAGLMRERKGLSRQQRSVDVQLNRLTSVRVRRIGRSDGLSRGATELQAYELSLAMQTARSDEAATLRAAQMASIEDQLQAIDQAIERLLAVDEEPRRGA